MKLLHLFLWQAKVVYVYRNPRDTVISFYHHWKLLANYQGKTLYTSTNLFVEKLNRNCIKNEKMYFKNGKIWFYVHCAIVKNDTGQTSFYRHIRWVFRPVRGGSGCLLLSLSGAPSWLLEAEGHAQHSHHQLWGDEEGKEGSE